MAKKKSKITPEEIVGNENDKTTKGKHRWDDDTFISVGDMKKISESIKEDKLKIRNCSYVTLGFFYEKSIMDKG